MSADQKPQNPSTKPDWDEGNTQMWVGPENQPTTNSITVGPEDVEAGFGPGSAEWIAAIKAEVERLRSVIRGCEIALNRDEYPDGARRLIREERANHGW